MRVIKLISALVMAQLVSTVASAATISGSHTTDGGKVVNLSGLEWLTWDETQGLTRSAIEAGAGGFITSGWRYASRTEMETFLDSLWGGTNEGWHGSNHDGADWLQDNMYFDSNQYYVYRDIFFGADGECAPADSNSCRGHAANDRNNLAGWFHEHYGLSFGTSTQNTNNVTSKANSGSYFVSALVRDTSLPPVPVPASGLLLIGALGGLGLMRRRKKS